jgi:hypothetical protein
LAVVAAFSMVCLMALPLAPQFVAFDRGVDRSMLARNADHGYSAVVSQSSFESLPSISGEPGVLARRDPPTALRAGSRDARRSTTRSHAFAGRQVAQSPAIAARFDAAPPGERVVEAGASADQEIVPQFRTLVFIETTEYVTSDSSVWSVQVWQVMWVSPVRERLARAPVAHSI